MTFSAQSYWDSRYADGGTSGAGSEGDAALAKGRFINDLIRRESITSIVDWGVGDGEVLSHITPEVGYTGIDISKTIIDRLRGTYAGISSITLLDLQQARHIRPRAELAISLDVIFHQVDDIDYHAHLMDVFTSATSFVLIHSSNHDGGRTADHVLWRQFTPDVERIAPNWNLLSRPDDHESVGFYLYRSANG